MNAFDLFSPGFSFHALAFLSLVGFGQNIHQAKPIGWWVEQPTPSNNHRCQLVAIEVDTVPRWSQSDMRSSSEHKLMVMQKYIDNLCDTYVVGEMCQFLSVQLSFICFYCLVKVIYEVLLVFDSI